MATRLTISPGGSHHPLLDQFGISGESWCLSAPVVGDPSLDGPAIRQSVLFDDSLDGMPIVDYALLCGQYVDDRVAHIAAFIGTNQAAAARAMLDRIRNNSNAQIFAKAA